MIFDMTFQIEFNLNIDYVLYSKSCLYFLYLFLLFALAIFMSKSLESKVIHCIKWQFKLQA